MLGACILWPRTIFQYVAGDHRVRRLRVALSNWRSLLVLLCAVGALKSFIRAIYTIFEGHNSQDPDYGAYANTMNIELYNSERGQSV